MVGELGGRKGVLTVADVDEIDAELKMEVEHARTRLMAGVAFEPDFRLGMAGEE